MILYRARSFGRPLGPWRPSRRAAEEDAERAGEASREPYRGAITYLSIGCVIDQVEGYGPPAPKRDQTGERRLPRRL